MKIVVQNAVPLVAEVAEFKNRGGEFAFALLDSHGGGAPRVSRHTGIKGLMLAVMEEGIRNYLGPNARLRSDAAYWIASNGWRSPFAFGTVCETLGLDPGAVRVALQQLLEKNIMPREAIGRSRPNVSRSGRLLARKAG